MCACACVCVRVCVCTCVCVCTSTCSVIRASRAMAVIRPLKCSDMILLFSRTVLCEPICHLACCFSRTAVLNTQEICQEVTTPPLPPHPPKGAGVLSSNKRSMLAQLTTIETTQQQWPVPMNRSVSTSHWWSDGAVRISGCLSIALYR